MRATSSHAARASARCAVLCAVLAAALPRGAHGQDTGRFVSTDCHVAFRHPADWVVRADSGVSDTACVLLVRPAQWDSLVTAEGGVDTYTLTLRVRAGGFEDAVAASPFEQRDGAWVVLGRQGMDNPATAVSGGTWRRLRGLATVGCVTADGAYAGLCDAPTALAGTDARSVLLTGGPESEDALALVLGTLEIDVPPFDFDRRLGLAFPGQANTACLAVPTPALPLGTAVLLVDERDSTAVVPALIDAASAVPCPREPPRPSDTFYLVRAPSAVQLAPGGVLVAVLADGQPLVAGPDGVSGDLDGDGVREFFRQCASMEGVHFTVWSGRPLQGTRRWHRYFALGYDVEPNCTEAEYRQ